MTHDLNTREPRTCPICRLGKLQPRRATYINQYGETVISAPNVPAWVCDVCGETEFDDMALQRVELLIGQSLLPPNRYRPPSARTAAANDSVSPARPRNGKASPK